MSGESTSFATPKRPERSQTGQATVATVEKVVRSVNKVLSKSEKLDRYASSAAKQAQSVVEKHVPMVLDYLPDKKIGKEFMFVLTVTVSLLTLFLAGAGNLLLDMTGVMYPWYASVLAIENPEKEKPEVTQWLSYWLIFCAIKTTEKVFHPLSRLIPMFRFLKILFLVWLYHPAFMGAKVLYTYFREPILALMDAANGFFKKDKKTPTDPDMPPPPPKSSQGSESSSSSSGIERTRSSSKDKSKEKAPRHLKQLNVVVKELSTVDEATIGSETKNPYFVELLVTPAEGQKGTGVMETSFKTNPRGLNGDGKAGFHHPIMFVDLGDSVEGCSLVIKLREKTTFEGTVDIARSTLSLSAIGGKRGSDSHVMTHSISLKGSESEFNLDIETDLKSVENPE